MGYTISGNSITFDEPPAENAEVEIIVSTQNNVRGFRDPNGFYPRRVNEVDTNRLAANNATNQHPVVQHKRERVDDLTGEPTGSYNARYPYNHVRETESGHIVEFDDTPGHERIHEYHRSGTFYEIHADGSRVVKVVGNGYEVVHGNKSVRVRGDVNVFVDGDAHLYVRGDMDAQVDENLKFNVGKNIDFHAGQNIRMFANASIEQTAQTTYSQISVGKMLIQSDADMHVATASNMSTSVLGNYDFITDGDYATSINGNFASQVTGTVSHVAEGTFTVASTGAMVLDTAATLNIGSGGAMNIDGTTVDLNTNGRSAVTITALQPRTSPQPAGDGIAPAMSYVDSGDLSSGIKAWSIDATELDTDGFATSSDAPKQAEVLEPKPFVPLKDDDVFFGSDDEEKSEEELRAGVESGEIKPTSFADYSYNSITGRYNTSGAARRVVSQPRVPDSGVEHSDDSNAYTTQPEASTAAPSAETTPTANYDSSGNFIGGVNYRLPLSDNFRLGQVSSAAVVSKYRIPNGGQHGLTQQQIIDNLKTLAVNCLEPIKAQYPNMFVTSGFRTGSSTSQHERGQAADMQFSGISKREYYDIAAWIRENVPHDQLLLEFKNTGSGLPWIHISCKESGNRQQLMTFFNHSRYGEVGRLYQLA